jgi:hypothetical protein
MEEFLRLNLMLPLVTLGFYMLKAFLPLPAFAIINFSLDWRLRVTLYQNIQNGIKELKVLASFTPFDFKCKEIDSVQTLNHLYGGDFKSDDHKVGDYRMPFYWEERLGTPLLFCHEDGRVGEGSHANLLLRNKSGTWYTPKLEEFILSGIGLRYGLEGLDFRETSIYREDLKEFDGAWFINSLRGPNPILKINECDFRESKKYQSEVMSIFVKNSLEKGFEL